MTSTFSWQNSVSLGPASLCTPRPNLPVTLGVSWLPTFAFQSLIRKRTSFSGVVLEGLVSLYRTIQLQLLQHYWLGHRLGLPWYWMVCLGNEQRSFCRFWDCIQVLGFTACSEVKASVCNSGDLGSIPGSGRSPGEGNGNPLQYSCVENSMEGGAWSATVHRVAKSQTRRSDFAFTFTVLQTFVDYDGYFISSKGFLPTVVDTMVVWVKFTHSSPLQFADS